CGLEFAKHESSSVEYDNNINLTISAFSAMFGAEFTYGWKCAPGAGATRFFCARRLAQQMAH
ncbi:MAG: hypothetical protein ACREQB_06035, partial [Candidatus Binataceae bacterium]